MLFLSGVGGGVTIDLTIPAGTALFFPVINAECSVIEPDPFHGDSEEELRACANGHTPVGGGGWASFSVVRRFFAIPKWYRTRRTNALGVRHPYWPCFPSPGKFRVSPTCCAGEH